MTYWITVRGPTGCGQFVGDDGDYWWVKRAVERVGGTVERVVLE